MVRHRYSSGRNAYAAVISLAGAPSVSAVADRLRIPRRWMPRLGAVLAAGSIGLVVGIVVLALGIAAAAGLSGYFVCTVTAHLRVHDRQVLGALLFLLLAVAPQ